MMTTNVELYEALKPTIGAEAARMIAEVVPPTRDLATKADAAEIRAQIAAVAAQIREEAARTREELATLRGDVREGDEKLRTEDEKLRTEMHTSQVSTLKWLFGFFVPAWLGTTGAIVAVLLRSA